MTSKLSTIVRQVLALQIPLLAKQFSIGQGFLPEVQLKLSIIYVRAITSALMLCSPVHLQSILCLPWQPVQNNSTTKMIEMHGAWPTGSFLAFSKEVQTKKGRGYLCVSFENLNKF